MHMESYDLGNFYSSFLLCTLILLVKIQNFVVSIYYAFHKLFRRYMYHSVHYFAIFTGFLFSASLFLCEILK